ncbi:hypothetical protein HDV01_004481 [Terramyces sp. JEL0728]|nr:hypothetical protein HDV01_004481 [Terramyces sp. JEL0728]
MSWFDPNQIKSSIGSIAQNLGNIIDDPDKELKQLSDDLHTKQQELEETQKELQHYKAREEELNNLLAKLKTHAAQKIKKLVLANEELSAQVNPDTSLGEIIHENTLLKEQNQLFQDKLAGMESGSSETEQLKIRVQKLEWENQELETESIRLQQLLADNANESDKAVDNSELLDRVDYLTNRVQSLNQENQELIEQFELERKEYVEQFELERKEYVEQFKEDKSVAELKSKISELESAKSGNLQKLEQENLDLNERITLLELELQDVNITGGDSLHLQHENAELNERIATLEAEIHTSSQTNNDVLLDAANQEKIALNDMLKNLEADLEKARIAKSKEAESYRSEIEKLSENIFSLNETIITLEAEIQGMEVNGDNTEILSLKQQLEQLNNELKNKDNEIYQQKESSQKALSEISQLQQELQDTKGVLDRYEAETDNLQDELEKSNQLVAKLNTELKGMKLEPTTAVSQDATEKLSAELSEMNARYQNAEQRIAQYKELENLNKALQLKNQESQTEIDSLKSGLIQAQDEMQSLKNNIEYSQQDPEQISDLTKQISRLQLINDKLNEGKLTAESQAADSGTKLQKVLLEMDQVQEASREEVLAITQMLDQVQQELDLARSSADKQIQQLGSNQALEVSSLNEKCAYLESEVARLAGVESIASKLQQQIHALEETSGHYANEITKLSKENAILDSTRFEQENQIHLLSQNEGVVTFNIEHLKSSKVEIENYMVKCEQLQKELIGSKDLEQQVISLQSQVEDYKIQCSELSSKLNSHTVNADEFNTLQSAIEQYKQQIHQLNTQLASKETEQPQEIVNLQSELNEYKLQCVQLNSSLAELNSLVENLSQENSALDLERTSLADKLSQFKLVVGAKMKAEIEESERLRNLLNHVSQEKDTLEMQLAENLSSHQATSDELLEIERLNQYIGSLTEKGQKDANEVARLREFLIEIEDNSTREALQMQATIDEYRHQIESLEREREQWESVAAQDQEIRESENDLLIDTKRQLVEAMAQITNLQNKAEHDAKSIENLQLVLQQFETTKESEIDEALRSLKNSLTVLEVTSKQFEERAVFAENELEHLQTSIQETQKLKQELEQKTLLVGQLRHDVVQLQSHLSEAMRRMKNGSDEDSVDRKLVSNLIIGFMTAPHGDRKRYEILSLMSLILKLNDEEKAKVGLIRQAGVPSPRQSQTGQAENFMDMWITFLVSETNKDAPMLNSPGALPSPQTPAAKEQTDTSTNEAKKGWLW